MLIDDVWTAEAMRLLELSCNRCRLLFATRQEDLSCPRLGRQARVEVRPMTLQERVELFRRHLGDDWQDSMDAHATEVTRPTVPPQALHDEPFCLIPASRLI